MVFGMIHLYPRANRWANFPREETDTLMEAALTKIDLILSPLSLTLSRQRAREISQVGWVTCDPRVAVVKFVTTAWVQEPTLQIEPTR